MPEPVSRLHIPSPTLGACLMAGAERDTQGCQLSDLDRFNFYPATPLASISWIFSGTLHFASMAACNEDSRTLPAMGPALPRLIFAGPQRQPTASWSPGPVHALTVGLYPEAATRLLGQSVTAWLDRTVPLDELAPPALLAACQRVLTASDQPFTLLEMELEKLWTAAARSSFAPFLSDWVHGLSTRALHANTGRSLRQWQRRIRDWTGQSQRDLQVFVRVEEAFLRYLDQRGQPAGNLADTAAASGFADQSHMGREVRRLTGHAPGQFGKRLVQDEAFWYYRLIGQVMQQTPPRSPR